MKKKILSAVMVFLLAGTLQAAVSEKVTVQLKGQAINCSGTEMIKAVLQYNGATYIPLRACGNMLGVSISYKDEKIYIGTLGSAPVKPGESITGEIEERSVSAKLRKQAVNINGKESTAEMIDYNGIMYVPLRAFGNFVSVNVGYENGVVQIGEAKTN